MRLYQRRLPPSMRPIDLCFSPGGSTEVCLPIDRSRQGVLNSGQSSAAMNRLLDEARTGPFYLGQPAIAEESYHHVVRNQPGFERIRHYMSRIP